MAISDTEILLYKNGFSMNEIKRLVKSIDRTTLDLCTFHVKDATISKIHEAVLQTVDDINSLKKELEKYKVYNK